MSRCAGWLHKWRVYCLFQAALYWTAPTIFTLFFSAPLVHATFTQHLFKRLCTGWSFLCIVDFIRRRPRAMRKTYTDATNEIYHKSKQSRKKRVSVLVVRKMEDNSRWRGARLLCYSFRCCLPFARFSRGWSDWGSSTFLSPQLFCVEVRVWNSPIFLSPHHWNLVGQRCSWAMEPGAGARPSTAEPELSPGTA